MLQHSSVELERAPTYRTRPVTGEQSFHLDHRGDGFSDFLSYYQAERSSIVTVGSLISSTAAVFNQNLAMTLSHPQSTESEFFKCTSDPLVC